MTRSIVRFVACASVLCAVALAAEKADKVEVKMKLLPTGAMQKIGGYRPNSITLSSGKPDGLKKAPEMASPLYGTIGFDGKPHLVAVDESEGHEAKLYVDANANGDLTDDPEINWTKRQFDLPNGTHIVQYSGMMKLPLKDGDKSTPVSLGVYRIGGDAPQAQAVKDKLLYFSDYAYEGEITLNGATYQAMIVDDTASGDFNGKADKGEPPQGPHARLLIDLNHDGKFAPRGEVFDAGKPFNIKGTTWELAAAGPGEFKITKSEHEVAEVLPPPDLSVGKKVLPFKTKNMDGKEVSFPEDYKGKLVMLDFWATWCGPCMHEVPGLVKAYEEFHPKGLEVLGVTLDNADGKQKVKDVTHEKGMTWTQVFDGKGWEAEIAQKYGIDSIPASFLVNGDTGEILATGNSLRGEELAPTIKKALEEKFKGKKGPA